jgi:hypothetical protein
VLCKWRVAARVTEESYARLNPATVGQGRASQARFRCNHDPLYHASQGLLFAKKSSHYVFRFSSARLGSGAINVKVILFGGTGMVGQGVLRECLLDSEVESVLAVGRSPTGELHWKLHEIVRPDLADLSPVEGQLSGYDACFFCLGVSSAGMDAPTYYRLTYELTTSIAATLVKRNRGMTFIYVSGAGTDSSERGRAMWARVKGKTENALLQMPFKAAYMFRPGYIQPLHGIRTKTKWYGVMYAVMGPLYPLWKLLFPKYVTTTECIGRAMIAVAKQGAPKQILESWDINSICGGRL